MLRPAPQIRMPGNCGICRGRNKLEPLAPALTAVKFGQYVLGQRAMVWPQPANKRRDIQGLIVTAVAAVQRYALPVFQALAQCPVCRKYPHVNLQIGGLYGRNKTNTNHKMKRSFPHDTSSYHS